MTATLLRDLRIWTGDGVAAADALLFGGGRIQAIGESAALAKGHKGRSIGCAGLTALPGLMDAHVHLELNPDQSAPPGKLARTERLRQMGERAAAMVGAGITTARDLGGGAWLELEIRDRIEAGALVGPRLLCAGQPITSPGGHCHFWGGEAADAQQATAVLQRQRRRGVNLIKVMATGGRITKGSDPAKAQFDLPTLAHIVAAASAHDLPVAAHCHGSQGIQFAAQAGVRTIEHCSWVGKAGWAGDYRPAVAADMAERGIWVSPTINYGWRRFLDNPNSPTLTRLRAAFQDMAGKGVPFIASTDAGIPGVRHHHLPLALPVFADIAALSPTEALRSATTIAADALGLAQITGRLHVGLAADIILVQDDPLQDLATLATPAAVWANGRDLRLPA